MNEYKVKQIPPNHADHISCYNYKLLQQMFETEAVIAQPKFDGERMLIHYNNGEVYCTSRRYSKKTNQYMENQDKLPILQEKMSHLKLDYTVLDCECYAKDWSTIVGILHSLPERAIELQKENAANFAIFDCLFYDGIDLRDKPYIERLAYAAKVVKMINYEEHLHLIQFMDEADYINNPIYAKFITSEEAWQQCMQSAIEQGFEGIVVKSLQKTYYEKAASLKCKKFETVDCVITGYKEGNGKYEGSIGALQIGYYDNGNFVAISHVNCGTDDEREIVNANRDKYLHKVVEVKCQEVTDKSLRHPVFVRFRDDKDYTMCTKETIFKE